jgi:hypothetical protein
LSEGLAYAYSPGLIQAGDSGPTDQLLSTVGRFMAEGSSLKDSYPRFNAYGLALRPLLKDALSGKRRKLDEFLPRATDAWLVLTELEKARSARSDSHAHDYRKDSRQSIFIFGPYNQADCELLKKAAGRHVFGRRHAADQYKEMLANNAKPGDTIILLLSLDDPSRIPEEYSDLAASPWPPIEGFLKQGRTVVKQRKARDMNIFLIAAPTVDSLHSEFRRLAGEGKFVLDAGARTK